MSLLGHGPVGADALGSIARIHPSAPSAPTGASGAHISGLAIEVLSSVSDDDAKRLSAARIAVTVRTNRPSLEMAGLALIASIDAQLQQIQESGSNSGAFEERDDLQNLKDQILQFLKALSENANDKPLEEATLSIKDGLKRWWTKNYEPILDDAYGLAIRTGKVALFASGLAMLSLGGVLTVPTALMVGAVIEGKTVVDTLKAAKHLME